MAETFSERLALADAQVEATTDEIMRHGITMADLPGLTPYLHAVIDQCYQIVVLAHRAARKAENGIDLSASLGHLVALFDLVHHFTCAAEQDLKAMHRDDTP